MASDRYYTLICDEPDYSDAINEAPPEELAAEVERAQQYNRDLASGVGIIDPFSVDVAQQNGSASVRTAFIRICCPGLRVR